MRPIPQARAGTTLPRLQGHHDVAQLRLSGPVGDDQNAPFPGSGEDPVQQLVGQGGVEAAGGFVEHEDRTGRQQGAGHRQAPALATGQGDAVLADRRVEPVGQGGHPGLEASRAQRVGDLRLGGVGPAEDEVGPHRAGKHLRPLVGQRAGRPRVGLAQLLDVGAVEGQRAVLERPVAQQRGDEARLAGAARAGDGDPAAGRQPHAHRVEGPWKAGVVAQGGVGESHVRHARRPAAAGSAGSRTGTGTSSSAKSRRAEARTSSERATAKGTAGTVSNVANAARGSTATMT